MTERQWVTPAAITVLAALVAMDAGGLDWQDRALCAQVDGDLFYPEKEGPGSNSARQAKRVCRECPVRAECLEYALESNEGFGVWGGLSARERRDLRRGMADAA